MRAVNQLQVRRLIFSPPQGLGDPEFEQFSKFRLSTVLFQALGQGSGSSRELDLVSSLVAERVGC